MANWKKVIVSGSAAHLLNITASNLTNDNLVIAGPGGALENSGLTYNGSVLNLGTTQVQAAGFTGSFTGSFAGDGAGLTGIVSNLAISGSTGGGTVALVSQVLNVVGAANEVETSANNQTITIGLPNNVTIGNNLIVNNNLTVIGTASFQHTSNLEVADRFVLLASGSNTTGDGGIVVQQATQDVGELFGWDSGVSRWGVTGSFTANQTSYTPDAFMAAVVTAAGTTPTPATRYNAVGNIYVSSGDESIWIYS
jgi:hypothetical protein